MSNIRKKAAESEKDKNWAIEEYKKHKGNTKIKIYRFQAKFCRAERSRVIISTSKNDFSFCMKYRKAEEAHGAGSEERAAVECRSLQHGFGGRGKALWKSVSAEEDRWREGERRKVSGERETKAACYFERAQRWRRVGGVPKDDWDQNHGAE